MGKQGILLILFSIIIFVNGCSLFKETQKVPFPDYLTPMMYGAKGDGKTDDTDAMRRAIYESDRQGKVLYLPSGYKYRVTGTLNFFQGEYHSYKLNMLGCIPIKYGTYTPSRYGGISVDKGVSLFKSATIRGSMERVCVTGKRDLSVRFFDHCECRGLVIRGCNISNFGVLFADTKVKSVSQITQNTFLTVYYFAKNEDTSSGFIDSYISFNYINGGMELDDNTCFEWAYYNGSIVSNNFVDYYRTVYFPKAAKKQAFVGPLSYANEYQVFRYFYAAKSDGFHTFTFSSIGDSFNWNDPASLEKLRKYESLTYKGKDGKLYEIPPYVGACHSTWNISIKDAKIERNMKSLVFIYSGLTEYEHNRFEVSFVGNNQYKKGQIRFREDDAKPYYNRGKYLQNIVEIIGIVEELEELPNLSIGWTSSFNGRIVQVNGQRYRAVNELADGKWKAEWKPCEKIE